MDISVITEERESREEDLSARQLVRMVISRIKTKLGKAAKAKHKMLKSSILMCH